MGRKPRSSEARDSNTRAAESRQEAKTTHQSRFYIPPNVIPRGVTYAWVAVAFDNAGTFNKDNWNNKFRAGWRPVPRDRHPELFPPVPNIGFGSDDDRYINEGGLILCEKPTVDVRRDRDALERLARQQMEGQKWTQAQGANPFAQTMPRFDESKTEFGHSAQFKE